jgi:hypothetical protein
MSNPVAVWFTGARLLGLRFRIPLEAWMFVLCVVQRNKPENQDEERSTEKVQREREEKDFRKKESSWGGGNIHLLCVLLAVRIQTSTMSQSFVLCDQMQP